MARITLKARTGSPETQFVSFTPVRHIIKESQVTYPTQTNDYSMDM
ncbi:MAG: hypothetical protein ACOX6H_02145 [Christensenellales bacterium]